MNKNKLIIVIVAVALVFFAAGFFSGKILTVNHFELQLKEFQQKWDQAKEYFGMAEWETNNLSGIVTEVKDNVIFADVGLSPNPFINWTQEREIVVTKNTEIMLSKRKDPEMMEKEWEDYRKKQQDFFEILAQNPEAEMDVTTPSELEVIGEANINQIKQGMEIQVGAGKNIAGEKRFEAVEIFVIQ